MFQGLGARSRRDLLRKTWVPQGRGLRDLEDEKSVVIRFMSLATGVASAHTCSTHRQYRDYIAKIAVAYHLCSACLESVVIRFIIGYRV